MQETPPPSIILFKFSRSFRTRWTQLFKEFHNNGITFRIIIRAFGSLLSYPCAKFVYTSSLPFCFTLKNGYGHDYNLLVSCSNFDSFIFSVSFVFSKTSKYLLTYVWTLLMQGPSWDHIHE